jgi:hypothetical protein
MPERCRQPVPNAIVSLFGTGTDTLEENHYVVETVFNDSPPPPL